MRSFFRRLEINNGTVVGGAPWQLRLERSERGYSDAQLDDYGGLSRRDYLWRPGTSLRLRARFSHPSGRLLGTAGFGFWNAPFGDPTVRTPTLPQATWFFYASGASDLPFPEQGAGRGWFVGTIDAATPWAAILAPLALPVMALNNIPALRRRLWPGVRRRLNISFAPLSVTMVEWHNYHLEWRPDGCRFAVDDRPVFETSCSPGGPLGFVCWLDNQTMVATPQGRLRWGTQPVAQPQWLEVADLHLDRR